MNPNKQLGLKLQEILSDESEDKLTADMLVKSIKDSGVALFHDQYEDAYLSPDGSGRVIYKISSKKCKLWILRYPYIKHNQVIGSDIVKRVKETLEADALFGGKEHKLYVRNYRNDEGIWYDLGDSAILINSTGWKVIDNPPIVFKRFSHQKHQVNPTKGGDVRQLFKYINVEDKESQILILVYIISAFIPGL